MTRRSVQDRLPERERSKQQENRLSMDTERPSHSSVVATAATTLIRTNDRRNPRGQGTRRTNRYTRNATSAPAVSALRPDWISAPDQTPHGGRDAGAICRIA